MTPGELIRARRLAHGLSQKRLAIRAGTTQAALSRLEGDEVSPSAARLAAILLALGETLELGTEGLPHDLDPSHLSASRARSPAERVELAWAWDRFAGELARAGAEARAR
ncbi:MAG: helix-turn-helix domain-containing protein [Thermoleophilaceae bacterium]|nr:helix-turn-helix domain-containing protein [Thermoleophilaceae bacterium]